MVADHDIVKDAQLAEDAAVLEDAGQSAGGDAVWGETGDLLSIQDQAAFGGFVKTGDDVEHRGLPGAIGADQPDDMSFFEGQIEIGDSNQTAEAHGEMLDLEYFHFAAPFRLPRSFRPLVMSQSQLNSLSPSNPLR